MIKYVQIFASLFSIVYKVIKGKAKTFCLIIELDNK